MFREIDGNLRACGTTLIASDLLFKAIALLLLTPLVSLLFRLFVVASGRTVLADADIARFLLHPLGWLAFVLVGGAVVCIFALEQAVLMTVCIGAKQQMPFQPGSVLLFVAANSARLLQLTSRIVTRLAIVALPFLAVGGTVFWLLLSDHDINFYLANKPLKFWLAVSLIGVTLFVMAGLMLKKITGWAFATQLLLYEKFSPGKALKESQQRSLGHRFAISRAIVAWAIFNVAVGFIVSVAVIKFGQLVVPLATGSLWTLVFTVGLVILLGAITNLATSLLSNASCASLLGLLYLKLAAQSEVSLPEISEQRTRWLPWNFTRRRMLVCSAIFTLIAGLVGATAMHGMHLEDRVEITAHRGGAGVAPENTLAAIRQAIEDNPDWIEIDVQETKDGVVVVAHDSDLARVGGNPVKIWEATADELRSIDIGSYFGRQFKDERVPTLEEVLKVCKGKVGVNIELKYYGHTQDLETRVIELVERFQMESEIVVMSLESKGINKMKSLRPEWATGLLTAVVAGDLTRANADFLAVRSSIASRGFIEAAHNRNKTVSAWTVNDGYAMSAMISRGVDNLITDYPAVARRVLAEREEMSPLERQMAELAFYLGVKPPTDGAQ